ncbi:MAG: hypothetical protein IPQ19_14225 [Bacteroidetes bacterium]|nr:hypothetical protein [Bacteroidota bacterium]
MENSINIKFPNQIDATNIEYPVCKSLSKKSKKRYFGANEIIDESTLKKGIRFNILSGNSSHRVYVSIKETNFGMILISNSEALNVSFPIAANMQNYYELNAHCNSVKSTSKVFLFEQIAPKVFQHSFQIYPGFFSCKIVKLNNGISTKLEQKNGFFCIDKFVFSLNKRFSLWEIFLLFFSFVLIIVFQIKLFKNQKEIKNPILVMLIQLRILLNNVALLSFPILILSIPLHSNRWLFLIAIWLVNFTFFIKANHYKYFSFFKQKFSILSFLLVFFVTILVLGFNNNEAFFQFPILLVFKILLIFLFFSFPKIVIGSIDIRYLIIIFYAGSLTFFTNDFGTLIYAFIACFIIGFFSFPWFKYICIIAYCFC